MSHILFQGHGTLDKGGKLEREEDKVRGIAVRTNLGEPKNWTTCSDAYKVRTCADYGESCNAMSGFETGVRGQLEDGSGIRLYRVYRLQGL